MTWNVDIIVGIESNQTTVYAPRFNMGVLTDNFSPIFPREFDLPEDVCAFSGGDIMPASFSSSQ